MQIHSIYEKFIESLNKERSEDIKYEIEKITENFFRHNLIEEGI